MGGTLGKDSLSVWRRHSGSDERIDITRCEFPSTWHYWPYTVSCNPGILCRPNLSGYARKIFKVNTRGICRRYVICLLPTTLQSDASRDRKHFLRTGHYGCALIHERGGIRTTTSNHAQLAGQVAATREAEVRLGQAISRWEGEKVDRLKFKKEYMAKCSEAQVGSFAVLFIVHC